MGGPIAHSAGTGRRARPGRRRTDREPRHGWRPALAIALVVAFVDWGTKAAVVATIPVGELVPVLDGRLAIWHVRNPAMILGLFGDLPLGYRKVMAALLAFTGAILLA